MASYVCLFHFTEQGAKGFRQSPARASAFAGLGRKTGLKVREMFWTLGDYDGLLVFEAPNDEAATSALLAPG